jgi:hypothetical protein
MAQIKTKEDAAKALKPLEELYKQARDIVQCWDEEDYLKLGLLNSEEDYLKLGLLNSEDHAILKNIHRRKIEAGELGRRAEEAIAYPTSKARYHQAANKGTSNVSERATTQMLLISGSTAGTTSTLRRTYKSAMVSIVDLNARLGYREVAGVPFKAGITRGLVIPLDLLSHLRLL